MKNILLFKGYTSSAQNLPQIIPPSPEATSFIRHGLKEISNYTRTPNISIPLHTIRENGMSILISVGYSGGDVKVDDISSIVGLGWNLNCGGMVTRSIRKLPDDSENYEYDDFNRLSQVKDADGNVLSNNEYKYKD